MLSLQLKRNSNWTNGTQRETTVGKRETVLGYIFVLRPSFEFPSGVLLTGNAYIVDRSVISHSEIPNEEKCLHPQQVITSSQLKLPPHKSVSSLITVSHTTLSDFLILSKSDVYIFFYQWHTSSSQHCHYDIWHSFFIDTQLCHRLTPSFRFSKPSISPSGVITFPLLYHFLVSYLHQPVHWLSLHRPCIYIQYLLQHHNTTITLLKYSKLTILTSPLHYSAFHYTII